MIETKHSLDFCKLDMEVTTFPYISLLSHCFLEGRRDCLISCMFTEFHCINTPLKHAVNLASSSFPPVSTWSISTYMFESLPEQLIYFPDNFQPVSNIGINCAANSLPPFSIKPSNASPSSGHSWKRNISVTLRVVVSRDLLAVKCARLANVHSYHTRGQNDVK